MNILPISILKGVNSDGSSFSIEQWDYLTYWKIQAFKNLILLMVIAFLLPFISPIVLLLAIFAFPSGQRFGFWVTAIASTIFLLDCYYGFVCLQILTAIASKGLVNLLVGINIIVLLVSIVFILIGKSLYTYLEYPIRDLEIGDYNYLNEDEKADLHSEVSARWQRILLLVVVIVVIGACVGFNYTHRSNNWAKEKIESFENKTKANELNKQQELGEFSSQKEKDEYFKNQEERWKVK